MKENLLVSACLVGKNTKYNGGNNFTSEIESLKDKYNFILVCPEVMGGLSIPRNPSEIRNGRVYDNINNDVSDFFYRGADAALKLVKEHQITKALLKDGSPSCGSRRIYDGTFTGNKISGKGITAQILEENHIKLYTEKEIDKLKK